MSEKEKLNAVGKAMNLASINFAGADHHTKKLIVMTKAHGGKAPRGSGKVKMVDKRMKNDMRSMKRAEKKKGGKGRKTKREQWHRY
jgi:hypothetical protein